MRTDNKLSVYESIIQSIKRDIAVGIYAGGERLPSCRDMAMRLGINPNTVQRAYSELEAQGIIYTIPKKGVYVGKLPQPGISIAQPLDIIIFKSSLNEAIVKLKEAGLSREEIIKIIDEVYRDD